MIPMRQNLILVIFDFKIDLFANNTHSNINYLNGLNYHSNIQPVSNKKNKITANYTNTVSPANNINIINNINKNINIYSSNRGINNIQSNLNNVDSINIFVNNNTFSRKNQVLEESRESNDEYQDILNIKLKFENTVFLYEKLIAFHNNKDLIITMINSNKELELKCN